MNLNHKQKVLFGCAAVLLAILLFPPVDAQMSKDYPTQNRGFAFIGTMGRFDRIRYEQWLIQFGVAGTICALVAIGLRKTE